MVRWCWVSFQSRESYLFEVRVGQGPIALAVGAGEDCLDIFSLVYHFLFLSPSLWETARYRRKYCLKGPLSPKQPTNQSVNVLARVDFFGMTTMAFGLASQAQAKYQVCSWTYHKDRNRISYITPFMPMKLVDYKHFLKLRPTI